MIKFHEKIEDVFELVKEKINEHDPIGLIKLGAPDDVYYNQIPGLVHAVQVTHDVYNLEGRIWDILIDWFGSDVGGLREDYYKFANDLFKSFNKKDVM